MNSTATFAQRKAAWFKRAVILVVCASGFGAPAAWAQARAEAAPPTIEKVIVGETGVANIEGEGKPGDIVQLMAAGSAIGEAAVAANGRWRVALKDGLKPGIHQIRAEARTDGQGRVAPGDEIRIAIPSQIGARAVVAYDGVTGDADRATRQRAEDLAQAAGQAFDTVTGVSRSNDAAAPPRGAVPEAALQGDGLSAQAGGPVAVVIEWLKRSARGYREDVVGKLRPEEAPSTGVEPAPGADRDEVAATAAGTIAKERAEAEARRIDLAEAETVRKVQDASKAEADARKAEAAKRKRAEELARLKAETDRRIAEDLERLKDAKAEADRAKAKPAAPQQKANITLERFYLPGQKRPAELERTAERERVAIAEDIDARQAKSVRNTSLSRCAEGRVIKRKGRRWYVTGANDTLWDIAERFYGSGTAYPRIYKVNRKRLASPHVVRPCLALRLPGRRG